jgi:hypothetical protein
VHVIRVGDATDRYHCLGRKKGSGVERVGDSA